jgi:hypothetical protein
MAEKNLDEAFALDFISSSPDYTDPEKKKNLIS